LKQFIVLAAVVPIMLAFIMQFTLVQIRHHRLIRMEELVHNARIEAAMDGGFTEEARARLASEIADIYDVAPREVVMEFAGPDGRMPGRISYRIGAPVAKRVAANRLFGISESDNAGYDVLEGEVLDLSAYLTAPAPDEGTPIPDETPPAPDETPSDDVADETLP
jgi:hypothetical protein